jgi:hypothetical protein
MNIFTQPTRVRLPLQYAGRELGANRNSPMIFCFTGAENVAANVGEF